MANQVRIIKTRTNAGVLSPLLDSRSDIPQYAGGCRRLENFVPRVHGAAFKRAGQEYRGTTKNNAVARFMEFNYDTSNKLQLEFSDRALRFWDGTPGELVTLDVSDLEQWTSVSTGGPDFYSTGSIIWGGVTKRLYAAEATNTPAVDNQPPAAVWSPSPAKRWVTGTAYLAGDIVATSASDSFKAMWLVLNAHSATTTPDVDTTNYAPLWHLGTVTNPGVYDHNWLTAEPYVEGEKITVTFTSGAGANLRTFIKSYRCTVSHTSAAGTKPGTGASWTTRWVETTIPKAHDTASVDYFIGDLVKVGALLYISTTNHTSSASNEPGDVGAPWVQVQNTVPWVTTSTQRQIGDWLMVGGVFVLSMAQRKSSATITLSLGANVYFKLTDLDVGEWAAKDAYDQGDAVVNDDIVYVAVLGHAKDAAKEPGSAGGNAYWQRLANVEVWQAAQSYVVGNFAVSGGVTYRCVQDHISGFNPSTSSAEDTDNSGPPDERLYWAAATDIQPDDQVLFNYDGGYSPDPNSSLAPNENQVYYCVDRGTDGTSGEWFKVSETLGGAPLSFADNWSSGDVQVRRIVPGSIEYDGVFAADLALGYWVVDTYILELATEYLESEIFTIKHLQVNDVVRMVHQLHPIMHLSRYANNIWQLAEAEWDYPPTRDENIEDDLSITPSATTGEITLTGAGRIFFPGMEGGFFSISHRRENSFTKLVLSAEAQSTSVKIKGQYSVFIFGTAWKGTLVLETSRDGTVWQQLRSWTQPVANMRTITATGTFDEPTLVRFNMTVHDAGGASDYAIIEAVDSKLTGIVRINTVESSSGATATVLKELGGTAATNIWAEGAYSDYRGFPSCITLHETRMGLAGNAAEPHVVRLSSIDGFEDFTPGSLDTSPFVFEMASSNSNVIRWIESVSDSLAIGTVGDEWIATSGSEGKIISPSNPPRVRRQSSRGSSTLGAIMVGDTLMFIQTNRRIIREFSYDSADGRWISQDMTKLAEHITASGIVQVAAARQPETIMYCVTGDGRLLAMTYDRLQAVVAWSEIITDGYYESVSVIYGDENEADQVWLIVRRTIGGVTVRYVERFHQQTSTYDFTGDALTLCYLDSAKIVTQASSTTVSGLDHLEGKTVMAMADGIVRSSLVVAGGDIVLPVAATKIVVGLPFTAYFQGMKIEVEDQQGTNQGKKWKLNTVVLKLFQSNGVEVSANPGDTTLPWRAKETGDTTDIAERVLLPHEFKWSIESRYSDATHVSVRSISPLPAHILSIVYVVSTSGN